MGKTEISFAAGAIAGFFGKKILDSDVAGEVGGGIVNLGGKIGNAFVSAGGWLYKTYKTFDPKLPRIKVDFKNPLRGLNGEPLALGIRKIGHGIGHAASAFGRGAGNVWQALTDSDGNTIDAKKVESGKVGSNGQFNFSGGISNDDIARLTNALTPTIQEGIGRLTNQIQGEPVDEMIDDTTLPQVNPRLAPVATTDNNKMILYVGGGIGLLLLILILQRSNNR